MTICIDVVISTTDASNSSIYGQVYFLIKVAIFVAMNRFRT